MAPEEEKDRERNGYEMGEICDPTKTEEEDLLSDGCDQDSVTGYDGAGKKK